MGSPRPDGWSCHDFRGAVVYGYDSDPLRVQDDGENVQFAEMRVGGGGGWSGHVSAASAFGRHWRLNLAPGRADDVDPS